MLQRITIPGAIVGLLVGVASANAQQPATTQKSSPFSGLSNVGADSASGKTLSLTYAILLSSDTIGVMTSVLTVENRAGKSVVHIESKTTSSWSNGTSEIAFYAPEFAPILSRTTEVAGSTTVRTDYRYEKGRILGTMTGLKGDVRNVNIEAGSGILLPGMEEFAIWDADFAKMKSFELKSLNQASGTVSALTFTNAGVVTVQLGRTEVKAYRIEVTGGPVNIVMYARIEAPHLIIKQEFPRESLTMLLTSAQ